MTELQRLTEALERIANALEGKAVKPAAVERGDLPVVPADLKDCWTEWTRYLFERFGERISAIESEVTLLRLSRLGSEKAAKDIRFSIGKRAKSILDSDNDFNAIRAKERQNDFAW